MLDRHPPAASAPPLKAIYSITELAELSGVSRRQMHRMVARVPIPTVRTGRKHLVLLSELRDAFPGLWDSIVDRHSLAW